MHLRWTTGGLALLCAGLVFGCAGRKVLDEDVYLVWPQPPDPPKIRYVTSYTGSQDFKIRDGNKLVSLIIGSAGARSLLKPYGVATDSDLVYVTDSGLRALWVFNRTTRKVTLFGHEGQGDLRLPTGVCPGDSGTVFVADSEQSRVFQYSPDGKLVQAFGRTGELSSPVGVAYAAGRNQLFVADSKNHHLVVFDVETGDLIRNLGERGDTTGQFNFPTNLYIRDGKLYITDTGNFRVQVLSLDGEFLSAFGRAGDGLGDFARPKGIGVDSDGHVYVVDAAFDNFQIFDDDGTLLLFVGSAGRSPGQFWLPAGLWVDAQNQIYVVDSYNQRVQVFEYNPDLPLSPGEGVPDSTGEVTGS